MRPLTIFRGRSTVHAVAWVAVALLLFGEPSPAHAAPNTIRRFYNLNNASHFWSADGAECASVLETLSGTYRYEGMAWTIESSQVTDPLYRAYNTSNGTHFYTANGVEYNNLPSNYSREGVAYYVSLSDGGGYAAVYRAYNTLNGAHFYTSNPVEYNSLPSQFVREGTAFYFPAASPVVNSKSRWPNNTVESWPKCRVYINYQPLRDDWEPLFYSARMQWNDVGRSNMYFTFGDSSCQNTFSQMYLPAGAPGWTEVSLNASGISRCVGFINTYYPWATNGDPSRYDVQSLFTHELGHFVEERDVQAMYQPVPYWPWATMWQGLAPGSTSKRTIAAEDIDGIRHLYGIKP